MNIDIDGLSEDELIQLNHKVVARLRFLREMRSHATMLDFRIGETRQRCRVFPVSVRKRPCLRASLWGPCRGAAV